MLLDLFQSIQRKNIPFMLVLSGLPTLFPRLVNARTYAERMFTVVFLDQLSPDESRQAIQKPIQETHCPVAFDAKTVDLIVRESSGYPYFIQFICRELYDLYLLLNPKEKKIQVPIDAISRKLDNDFFAGRWSRVTDRQRDLLVAVTLLKKQVDTFTIPEVMEASAQFLDKKISRSHANQLLATLGQAGLVYKNKHGEYCFAVPMLRRFILRQLQLRKVHTPQF